MNKTEKNLKALDQDMVFKTSVKVLEQEGESKSKRLEVRVIEKGMSKSQIDYTAEFCAELAEAMSQRNKAYLDHDIWAGPARSFKDFVGIYTEPAVREDGVYAVLEVANNPQTSWIYDFASEHPDDVGVSIDARIRVKETGTKGEDGYPFYEATGVVALNSIDIVTYPGAGGKAMRAVASAYGPEGIEKLNQAIVKFSSPEFNKVVETINSVESLDKLVNKLDSISSDSQFLSQLEGLKEVPELIKALNKIKKPEKNPMEKNTQINSLESLKSEYPSLVKEMETNIRESLRKDFKTEEERKAEIKKFQTQIDTLESEKSTLTNDKQTLEKKIDALEAEKAARDRAILVDKLVQESELPEAAITDSFRKSLTNSKDQEEMEDLIADRKHVWESASKESGNSGVAGNGQRGTKKKEGGEKEITDDDIVGSITR